MLLVDWFSSSSAPSRGSAMGRWMLITSKGTGWMACQTIGWVRGLHEFSHCKTNLVSGVSDHDENLEHGSRTDGSYDVDAGWVHQLEVDAQDASGNHL